jgi:hypothetical protein
MNTKNIISFLFSLFAFITINGFGNSIDTHQTNIIHIETTDDISQSPRPADNHNIIPIEGILQTSIKTNESNSPTFQDFKNSKKSLNSNSFLQSFLFSKSCYAFYCSNRTNSVNTSPFYIAYHRLII